MSLLCIFEFSGGGRIRETHSSSSGLVSPRPALVLSSVSSVPTAGKNAMRGQGNREGARQRGLGVERERHSSLRRTAARLVRSCAWGCTCAPNLAPSWLRARLSAAAAVEGGAAGHSGVGVAGVGDACSPAGASRCCSRRQLSRSRRSHCLRQSARNQSPWLPGRRVVPAPAAPEGIPACRCCCCSRHRAARPKFAILRRRLPAAGPSGRC